MQSFQTGGLEFKPVGFFCSFLSIPFSSFAMTGNKQKSISKGGVQEGADLGVLRGALSAREVSSDVRQLLGHEELRAGDQGLRQGGAVLLNLFLLNFFFFASCESLSVGLFFCSFVFQAGHEVRGLIHPHDHGLHTPTAGKNVLLSSRKHALSLVSHPTHPLLLLDVFFIVVLCLPPCGHFFAPLFISDANDTTWCWTGDRPLSQ